MSRRWTDAQVAEIGRRIMARVEGKRLSPAQVREAVAEEIVKYEQIAEASSIGPVTAEVLGAIDRVPQQVADAVRRRPHDLSEAEFRRYARTHAEALLPEHGEMPSRPPTVSPALEKAPHEMTREEFSAFQSERAHELLPGDELGPPDPRDAA